MIDVGQIQSIWRFPVKSMRGESIDSCQIYWYGIEGDRRYAFVRGDTNSNFPWLTARQVREMLAFTPQLRDPSNPLESPIDVTTPSGDVVPVESGQLRQSMQRHYGAPVHLMQLRRGAYDAMAISIISTATVQALSRSDDPRRYRANFVVKLNEPRAFAEDRWAGAQLRLGDRDDAVRLRVLRPAKRCKVICIDPDTQAIDPRYLEECAAQHDAFAAMYCVPETIGTVRAGDSIYLAGDAR
jgi:uncharacterized protein YcbX